MADVFISYSRIDTEFAKKLVNSLKKDDRDVWVDWEDIPEGEDWLDVIYEGIENADTFIFIVSRNSLISEVCNYEVKHARENNKRIIPVIYERIEGEVEQEVKSAWFDADWKEVASANWSAIGHINWVFPDNEKTFDDFFKKLIKTVETDYAHVKAHTRYQVRALDWQRGGTASLLIGEELISAEGWHKVALSESKEPSPTALHQEFISESRKAEDARAQRIAEMESRTRNARRASIGLIATLILGGIVALFIVGNVNQQANFAQETSIAAQNDADNAETSVANAQIQEAEAIALADEAESIALAAQAEATQALENAIVAQNQATQASQAEATALAQEAEARTLADDAESSALTAQAQATQAGVAEALALTQQADAIALADDAESSALTAQAQATQAGVAEALALTQQADAIVLADDAENIALTAQAQATQAVENVRIAQTQAAVADAQVEEANAELEVAEVNLVTATFVVEQLDTIQVTAAAINTQVVYSIATVTQSAIISDIASTFGDALFGLQNNPVPVEQISTMNSLVARYPQEAQAYLARASIYISQENFSSAIEDYTRAIELAPDDLDVYFDRGYAFLRISDFENALTDLSYVIDNHTETRYGSYALLYRSQVYQNTEQLELALADATTSIEIAPGIPYAYRIRSSIYEDLGNTELAMQDRNHADALNTVILASGELYSGNIEEGSNLINQAIALDPEFSGTYLAIGEVYLNIRNYDLAIEHLERAVELDPENSHAYSSLGQSYYSIQNFDFAIEHLERAVELDPENSYAYFLLGMSHFYSGNYDLAIANLSRRIELEPEHGLTYYQLGRGYIQLSDFNQAIDNFNLAIENGFLRAYLNLGNVYYELGEYELALENFEAYEANVAPLPEDAVELREQAEENLGN